MSTEQQAINAIESLLVMAHSNAAYKRRPTGVKPDVGLSVSFHCGILDDIGISYHVQNVALQYINDANEQKTWEFLYDNSKHDIAKSILSGASFMEVV